MNIRYRVTLTQCESGDLQLDRPRSQVLLRGKGRKERIVPIPSDLVKALKSLMNERGVALHETRPLFVGTHETRLTRFGATHIVRRAVATATLTVPNLARCSAQTHLASCLSSLACNDPSAIWRGPSNHPGLARAFASRHHASLRRCRRRDDATRAGKGGCLRQRCRSLQTQGCGAATAGTHLIFCGGEVRAPAESAAPGTGRHIYASDTYVRVAFQLLLNLKRQTLHATTHVGVARRDPHPHSARHRDHRSPRMLRTRRSASTSTSLRRARGSRSRTRFR